MQSWRVGLATSDNWFLRPSQRLSPGPQLQGETPISQRGEESPPQSSSPRSEQRGESPLSVLGVEDCSNSGSDFSDEVLVEFSLYLAILFYILGKTARENYLDRENAKHKRS